MYVIVKKYKVVFNMVGGGYSVGWGEKLLWYNVEGGRVKE